MDELIDAADIASLNRASIAGAAPACVAPLAGVVATTAGPAATGAFMSDCTWPAVSGRS